MRPLASILFMLGIWAALMPAAFAQNEPPNRTKVCEQAATAHGFTGEARRSFMADCLKGETSAARSAPPKPPARSCKVRAKEADAQKLKGEARTLFMSGCTKI